MSSAVGILEPGDSRLVRASSDTAGQSAWKDTRWFGVRAGSIVVVLAALAIDATLVFPSLNPQGLWSEWNGIYVFLVAGCQISLLGFWIFAAPGKWYCRAPINGLAAIVLVLFFTSLEQLHEQADDIFQTAWILDSWQTAPLSTGLTESKDSGPVIFLVAALLGLACRRRFAASSTDADANGRRVSPAVLRYSLAEGLLWVTGLCVLLACARALVSNPGAVYEYYASVWEVLKDMWQSLDFEILFPLAFIVPFFGVGSYVSARLSTSTRRAHAKVAIALVVAIASVVALRALICLFDPGQSFWFPEFSELFENLPILIMGLLHIALFASAISLLTPAREKTAIAPTG